MSPLSKRFVVGASVLVSTCIGLGLLTRMLSDRDREQTLQLAHSIDEFVARHGRLPSQDQVEFPTGRHFYEPRDGGYVVGFSVGFDWTYRYYGPDGGWTDE